MSFDLSGYSFGDNYGFQDPSNQGLMNRATKATLFVFRPRNGYLEDVALRPLSYQFDENFLTGTQEVTSAAMRGSVPESSLVNQMMQHTNFSDNMIMPLAPQFKLHTSELSSNYRFILVLTQSASDLKIANTYMSTANSSSQQRRIYTGYFVDEPFNEMTFGSHRRTLNPHCFMVITHKTMVGTSIEHGAWGPQTNLTTQSSEEIFHPELFKGLSSPTTGRQTNDFYLMTPDLCVNGIDATEDGVVISVPGVRSDLTNDRGSHVFEDYLEQPTHNVAKVVKGLMRHQAEMSSRDRLSTRQVDRMFEDSFGNSGLHRTSLSRHLQTPRSRKINEFDLDIDSRISPEDINQMTNGDLDVIPIDMEAPSMYETADQMEASSLNMYSSLIASVVGPVLNSAGLNELTFEYQIAKVRGQIEDDFRVYAASPNFPVPDADLKAMVNAVKMELINGIFAAIYGSRGDFVVMVQANNTGMTSVNLALVAAGYRSRAPFEIPSFLGGLVSPLVGDPATSASNSEAIEMLYGHATGSSGYGTRFDDDDKDFMNYASSISNWDDANISID